MKTLRTWQEAGFSDPKNGAAVPAVPGSAYETIAQGDRAPEAPKKRGREPVLVRLSDVTPREVRFLWDPFLPTGKLSLLEGDPEAGKTFVALAIVSAVSTGAPLLGRDGRLGEPRDPATSVYMTAEDGLDDTIRPRLDSMGGDSSKVQMLTGWIDRTQETPREGAFTLADVDVLRGALELHRPSLVVIDPLQAFLGPCDMHRANEVRPLLAGLGKLAEEFSCAVLAIRHLSKAPAARALYRGLGSIDFTAAARSVLLAGECLRTKQRAFVHAKSSLAPAGPSIGYELDPKRGFSWTGLSDLTANDLLASEADAQGSTVDKGEEFLVEALSRGPRPSDEVLAEAKAVGISERTIDRAKKAAGVRAFQRADEAKARRWWWSLPDIPGQGAKATSERQSATHTVGALTPPEDLRAPERQAGALNPRASGRQGAKGKAGALSPGFTWDPDLDTPSTGRGDPT